MNTIFIESEARLLQLLRQGTAFRGQSDATWKLESRVERDARKKFGESFLQQLPDFEASLIDQFIDRCTRLELGDIYGHNKLPHNSNTFEWLSLMQHYGHPTRLIDFTDDVRVALFFALFDEPVRCHGCGVSIAAALSDTSIDFAIFGLQMLPGNEAGNKLPKNSGGEIYRASGNGELPNVNELLGLAIKFRHFQSPYGTKSLGPEWEEPRQNYGWDAPKIQNVRIKRQKGRFLYQLRLDGKLENIPHLTKYTVSASLRNVAKSMFESFGHKYSKEFLYPKFEQMPLCPTCQMA
jgi:hypothetical protein